MPVGPIAVWQKLFQQKCLLNIASFVSVATHPKWLNDAMLCKLYGLPLRDLLKLKELPSHGASKVQGLK